MPWAKKGRGLFFPAIIACLILSTLLPPELAGKFFYQALWFKALGFILSLGIVFRLIDFIKRRAWGSSIIFLGILLILFAGLLSSLRKESGYIEIKEGQTMNGFWIEDDLFRPLNFSLTLKDVSAEYYPGQEKAARLVKSYQSRLLLHRNGGLLKEGLIEVNNPLRFEGFWFYQYAYDGNLPEQTILQVVKDPGLKLAYCGAVFLLLGMILSFKKIFLRSGGILSHS